MTVCCNTSAALTVTCNGVDYNAAPSTGHNWGDVQGGSCNQVTYTH
jgi:hypothetical protein